MKITEKIHKSLFLLVLPLCCWSFPSTVPTPEDTLFRIFNSIRGNIETLEREHNKEQLSENCDIYKKGNTLITDITICLDINSETKLLQISNEFTGKTDFLFETDGDYSKIDYLTLNFDYSKSSYLIINVPSFGVYFAVTKNGVDTNVEIQTTRKNYFFKYAFNQNEHQITAGCNPCSSIYQFNVMRDDILSFQFHYFESKKGEITPREYNMFMSDLYVKAMAQISSTVSPIGFINIPSGGHHH